MKAISAEKSQDFFLKLLAVAFVPKTSVFSLCGLETASALKLIVLLRVVLPI